MSWHTFSFLFCEGLLGAFLASIGFGVLFNVRGRSLFLAGLTGGIGGLVYKLALVLRLNGPMANFAAAVVLSLLAEVFARTQKTTVTTFTACALIPLVPGGTAYEMMVEFSQSHPMLGLSRMMDMISVSGMLAIGILTVSTLTRFLLHSKRRMKNGLRAAGFDRLFAAAVPGKHPPISSSGLSGKAGHHCSTPQDPDQ